MSKERQRLKRTLGRVEVFALAFGTMVGWGCIVLPIQWVESGGVLGAILSLSIASAMCLCVGLTYAELTSTFPVAGGELAFTYRALGSFGAWVTSWTISLAYISVAAWEGVVLPTALNYIFPLEKSFYLWNFAGYNVYFSWVVIGIIGSIILTILNIIGVRQVAIFQILLLLIMIVAGLVFVFGGIAFGSFKHTEPILTDISGVGAVLIMAPSMFIGFDMVSKSAEEMNMPFQKIAKVLTISICAAGTWYILMTISTYLLLPPDSQVGTNNTIADVAAYGFKSPTIARLIIFGGICGIITSWNGFMVGASRIIFAMSRAKMLPSIFGIVHPKYKTPVTSIIFVGLICCICPFLGQQAFIWLVNIAAFGTVLAYLLVSISFLIIRQREPDLRREYKVKHGQTIGITAIICAIFFLFWYTPFSPTSLTWPHEWAIIGIWMILGMIFFAIFKISQRKKTFNPMERELLIFGEGFSRESKK